LRREAYRREGIDSANRGEAVKITTIGKGNVGGGLARLWRAAGHDVTELGRDGGDASDAEVVLVAVPSGTIREALGKVTGLDGKTAIDAMNAFHGRDEQFASLAHEVKSIIGGPTAKAFNANFAAIYGEAASQRLPPSNIFACDDEAREVTERLIRDTGYDPVYAGGLDNARLVEDQINMLFAISQNHFIGTPYFYRYALPGEL
jgi:predicted dinucleotide-binding enzyme